MKKILVIEDEHDIRLRIVKMLKYEGYETIAAEDGLIGVQLAKDQHPDLIVCDVLMPRLNGYGVLTELRHDPVTAAIPFIFLTAKSAQDDMRKGMTLGADDYLTKPFTMPVLLAAVTARLEKQAVISKTIDLAQFNISHALPQQFQTPLNSIIGFTEFLIHFAPDLSLGVDDILDMQRSILESALHLKRLIENYLLYAHLRLLQYKPERQQAWQHIDALDAAPIIAAAALQKTETLDRQGDLHLQLVEGQLLQISAASLQKIVEELCDNACQFSEPGTPIHVETVVNDDKFLLNIIDHGQGMTQEHIATLGKHLQYDPHSYVPQPGLGLGLTIARLLVERYGGTLTVESRPNEGTTVIVAFG